MGRSNIHGAEYFIQDSGRGFRTQVAFIEYAQRLVYLITANFDQQDLDRFADILREGKAGSWICRSEHDTDTFTYCQGDRALPVPKAVISRGLQNLDRETTYYGKSVGTQELKDTLPQLADLSYVIIVQGQTGNAKCKLIVEPSLDRASSAIMSEVLNGYSVVFTASMLKEDLPRLSDRSYGFRAVEQARELRVVESLDAGPYIKLWC